MSSEMAANVVGGSALEEAVQTMRRPSRTNTSVWRRKSQRIGPSDSRHFTTTTISNDPRDMP
jgi:hypothetical protein